MEQQTNTQHSTRKNEIFEWTKAIIIAVMLAYFIRVFLFTPFMVEGTSMMPTLLDGERLIVNNLIYNIHPPKRGDIIVFHYNQEKDYIKRVIALPGDIIEMKQDQLYINGQAVAESFLHAEKEVLQAHGLLLTKDFAAIQVEAGHLFVMGDNRRNSEDSRSFGTIGMDQVIGRADIVFWPISNYRYLGEELKVGE